MKKQGQFSRFNEARNARNKASASFEEQVLIPMNFPKDEYFSMKSEIRSNVFNRLGDAGTCVIGESMSYKGFVIAEGFVQGCVTNETFFEEFRSALIEKGFDPSGFGIDYGRMD